MDLLREDDIIEKYDWRQIRFCHEYLLDEEPYQAARRAGYKEEEAEKQGRQILNNNDLLFLIYSLADKKGVKLLSLNNEKEKEIDKNFIVCKLLRIADFNSQAIFTEDGLMMRNASAANKSLETLCRIKGLFAEKDDEDKPESEFTELVFRDGNKVLKLK